MKTALVVLLVAFTGCAAHPASRGVTIEIEGAGVRMPDDAARVLILCDPSQKCVAMLL